MRLVFVYQLYDIPHLVVPHVLLLLSVLGLLRHHELIHFRVDWVCVHELRVLVVGEERHHECFLEVFVEVVVLGQRLESH